MDTNNITSSKNKNSIKILDTNNITNSKIIKISDTNNITNMSKNNKQQKFNSGIFKGKTYKEISEDR